MSVKQQLQTLSNQLDKCKSRLATARQRNNDDHAVKLEGEIETLAKKIAGLKGQQGRQMSVKAEAVKALAFSRTLSKTEQADMGALKKSVRGLVVVHPLTALGREMELLAVTGFAPGEF
jgi:ribosome-associated protein